MKKNNVLRGFNLFLSSLIGLLGFGSCDEANEIINGGYICEYGVPYATYVFKAKVTNPKGSAVEGERIIIRQLNSNEDIIPNPYNNDTIYTDNTGEARLESTKFPNKTFRIVAEDPTGKYERDSVDVKPKQVEKGKGGWYDGKFEATANFKLREKTEK